MILSSVHAETDSKRNQEKFSLAAMAGGIIHPSFSSLRLQLISAFLAMEPTNYLVSLARQCGGGLITEEVQGFILEHCICHSVEKCYSPSHSFIQNFLKKLIIAVESGGGEVLDDLYEHHAHYLTSSEGDKLVADNRKICKSITFLFPEGKFLNQTCPGLIIPLHCSLNMLEGDTGCSIWPSSLLLTELILSYPEFFTNKCCFEVGSGVGLVGIALTYVNASRVILSDGDLLSFANLKLNLEMNQQDAKVECKHLPWEATAESDLQCYNPDVVLGADVVYDPMCLPHLVRVLATLLNAKRPKPDKRKLNSMNGSTESSGEDIEIAYDGNVEALMVGEKEEKADKGNHQHAVTAMSNCVPTARKAPVAYMTNVIRNPSTFEYFLELANEAHLSVIDITETWKPLDLLQYMGSYDRTDIRLYKISFRY